MSQDELTVINGWALYSHPLFLERYEELVDEVERLEANDPDYLEHPTYKLATCVHRAISQLVPEDPNHDDFRQGRTLGKAQTHWRRVKKMLPSRYRLFFQFRSKAPRTAIYAWLNSEETLRKAGSRTDCYAVFKAMVDSGRIPNSFQALQAVAEALPSAS